MIDETIIIILTLFISYWTITAAIPQINCTNAFDE